MIITVNDRFRFARVCKKYRLEMGEDYYIKDIIENKMHITFEYDNHETLVSMNMNDPEFDYGHGVKP